MRPWRRHRWSRLPAPRRGVENPGVTHDAPRLVPETNQMHDDAAREPAGCRVGGHETGARETHEETRENGCGPTKRHENVKSMSTPLL
jgi:hypothetical protein